MFMVDRSSFGSEISGATTLEPVYRGGWEGLR